MARVLSDQEKFDILQMTSGHFTCGHIPDDWNEMESEKQDQWLDDHVWEAFEYWPASDVWDIIDSAAFATISLIEEKY